MSSNSYFGLYWVHLKNLDLPGRFTNITTMTNQNLTVMRLFDLCLRNLGTHGKIEIYLHEDHLADTSLNDVVIKVYHQDGHLWELTRKPVFEEGKPKGYEYLFYEQDPEISGYTETGFEKALSLIKTQLIKNG